MPVALHQLLSQGAFVSVFCWTCAFFAAIYFAFAGSAWVLSRYVLPAAGLGRMVDERPLRDGQIGREIRRSLVSIGVFGALTVVQVLAYRSGWIRLNENASALAIAVQTVVLLLWNEVHFYACHALLHRRWFYRHVHRIHHESVVATPFATYSFHWLEALLLGSVMMFAMLAYDFHPLALGSLPLFSLFFNTIGHWNYDVFGGQLRSASVEHARHHSRVGGNYGFYLPWLDRLFGTHLS